MRRWRLFGLVAALGLLTTSCVYVGQVSVNSSSDSGNGPSSEPALSLDGRYVAFTSTATNLVANDTNAVADVFVRDNATGAVDRVSVATGTGAQANAESGAPSISYDGRYVAFESYATNLVSGDTNGHRDVFVRDRQAGTTVRVSVSSAGTQGNGESRYPSISANGLRVAFESTSTNLGGNLGGIGIFDNIFLRDIASSNTYLESAAGCTIGVGSIEANGPSSRVALSGDGNWVAFESLATNLYSGDTNNDSDVFLAPAVQRCAGWSEQLMDVPHDPPDGFAWFGREATISYDGRYVGFDGITFAPQFGSNDVRVDRYTNTVDWTLPTAYQDEFGRLSMSTDGREFGRSWWDVFPNTHRGFVYDMSLGLTQVDDTHRTLVSTDQQQNPVETDPSSSTVLSPDGNYAAWTRADGQVILRYVATITATNASPSSASRGTSGTIALWGTGFASGMAIEMSGTGVTLGAPTIIGTTLALIPYAVSPSAPTGAQSIVVTRPPTWSPTATASSACGGCLTVT